MKMYKLGLLFLIVGNFIFSLAIGSILGIDIGFGCCGSILMITGLLLITTNNKTSD